MDGWRQMDGAALDDAYVNVDYIPDGAAYPARWAADAAAFRAAHPPERIAYGEGARETLDLFRPDGAPHGLVVFVHGGYWRRFGISDFSHFARGGLESGHAVALVGYPLAPEARISEITRCVLSGIDAAAARVEGPVRLVGHSAGGHLVARAAMPEAGLACLDRVATCVPVSPVSDLRPLVPQSMNEDLRLDEAEAEAESPALGRPAEHVRVAVHVGAQERPSFLWQARALGDAWGAPVIEVPGKHHFDVIDALLDPGSKMMRDVLG